MMETVPEEEDESVLELAIADGFTLLTIELLERTMFEALGLEIDGSIYLQTDKVDEKKEMISEMLESSHMLLGQQIQAHGIDICKILAPSTDKIETFSRGGLTLQEVMKYDHCSLERRSQLVELAAKMYEDNLYSIHAPNRLSRVIVALIQSITSEEDPLNSSSFKKWMNQHSAELDRIEIESFREVIAEFIADYMPNIQAEFTDMIKGMLITRLFHLACA